MSDKKLLEKSPLSGITVPIAIVLVGALIIFGVTRMLSSGKNHRDLVEELKELCAGALHSHAHHRLGKLGTREGARIVRIPRLEHVEHAVGGHLVEGLVHLLGRGA